jgi:hypothetical protein
MDEMRLMGKYNAIIEYDYILGKLLNKGKVVVIE